MPSINTLKNLAFDAQDLSEVLSYFYDLSAQEVINDISELLPESAILANPELQSMLSSIKDTTEQFLKQEMVILDCKLFVVPEERFYHGLFLLEDLPLPLTFFYFSDIKTGIFSFTQGKETKMFRFTLARGEESYQIH